MLLVRSTRLKQVAGGGGVDLVVVVSVLVGKTTLREDVCTSETGFLQDL